YLLLSPSAHHRSSHSFPTRRSSDLIVFHRPRFAPDGTVRDSARVTVLHNGVLVQDNTIVTGWTVHGRRAHYQPHPDRLPLCSTVDRKSTRLNSSHVAISYAVFCLKK